MDSILDYLGTMIPPPFFIQRIIILLDENILAPRDEIIHTIRQRSRCARLNIYLHLSGRKVGFVQIINSYCPTYDKLT